jgi:predicted AlkP superfamily pyrophosphatase or phosphodiesterase
LKREPPRPISGRVNMPKRTYRRVGSRIALLLLLAWALPSRGTDAPARRRAVLISFDALGGDRLQALLARPGALPAGGFRRIAERGFVADRAVPPTPALTAVSHITIATGALPASTGIVSNTMLDRSKPFGTTISGFDAPIRAETLWEAAHRQGKRVGSMLFPGADGKVPARRADWGMTWPDWPPKYGKRHRLGEKDWRPGETSEKTFSPARRISLPLGSDGHALTVVAVDGTDDSRVDYDHLRIEPEVGAAVDVRAGDWFSVEVRSDEGRTGAWCKLLALEPDLSRTELYIGPLNRNTGYPREFVRSLDENVGFWPGRADVDAFGAGSDQPEVFFEQLERLADHITRAQLFAIARKDWDLLLCYQPEIDSLGHEFWITDPAQRGFTWDRAAKSVETVDRAYALADRSVDAIERALTTQDGIFVTSDHGMTPIWSEIYPNEILRHAGLASFDSEKKPLPSSSAYAVTDGAIANVYLKEGVDPSLREKVERLFRELRVRGESPFETIARREEAGSLGLNAPESGDLILIGKIGTHFSKGISEAGSPVGPTTEHATHGYLNTHREIQAAFLAAGPGISRERVETIGLWQIAARVSGFLGIDPPRDAAR